MDSKHLPADPSRLNPSVGAVIVRIGVYIRVPVRGVYRGLYKVSLKRGL